MAKFCPECGKSTVKRDDGGRARDACPDGHFVQYAKSAVGVGALVFRDGAVLVVERGIPPVGLWTIPGGWVEQEDHIQAAVEREVKEETNVDVRATGIVFIRNNVGEDLNSLYFVFLCEMLDPAQEPIPDGDESTDALFVEPSKFDTINLSFFSKWLVEQYLSNRQSPLPLTTIDNYNPDAFIFAQLST